MTAVFLRAVLRRLFYATPALTLVFLFCSWTPAHAQIPDKFTNLQVLPKDISKKELTETMKTFAISLGVRCIHCHVGEAGQPLSTFDFASDKKPTKKIARIMIKMRNAINQQFLAQLDDKHPPRVGCVTCHDGQKEPDPPRELLNSLIQDRVKNNKGK